MRLLRTIAKREVCTVVLLLGGSGALCYGWLFHTVQVYQEEEREVSVAVPTPFGPEETPSEQPPPNDGGPAEGVDPFRSPPEEPAKPEAKSAEGPSAPQPPPGVTFQKVTEKYWEARYEPEWVVTRDVTVGGLARLADGQLRRTYSGKPPSLCPT